MFDFTRFFLVHFHTHTHTHAHARTEKTYQIICFRQVCVFDKFLLATCLDTKICLF